jgi:biotin carboxyl carrier protein
MRYFVEVEGETLEVEVSSEGILVDGEPVDASLTGNPGDAIRGLRMGDASWELVPGSLRGDELEVHLRGRPVVAAVVDERTRRIREMSGTHGAASGPRPLKAPMPGLVVKVEVEAGQAVQAGDGLVIVEAMKMENELKADVAGVVARVLVEPGQAVDKDQVLVDFQAPEPEGGEAPDPEGAEARPED